jgi:retron-type reverse transcriptase
VREAARKDECARFTALLHHVTVDLLRDSFYALKRQAAPGLDGVTWPEYEADLEDRLVDLHRRVHTGTYRAQPSKRAYIPKPDGRKRPLGIAVLEDKIVQQAVVTVLNQIYEVDFLGFSYGFRPGRSAHDALDALWVGIMGKKVNWVLDADIQSFFDTISLDWLGKFLEHRIADRRLLRLIQKRSTSEPMPKVVRTWLGLSSPTSDLRIVLEVVTIGLLPLLPARCQGALTAAR